MGVPFHVISTGSQGNAVIVNDFVLIDCGVPYKAIEPHILQIKLVLLTHIHSDHFRPSTIKRIHDERPTVRFGCCHWLVRPLVQAGVSRENIDVLKIGTLSGYGLCNVIPVPLSHDVPNCGYKIHFETGKVFYATDTANLNGITARHYDLYLIEANYGEEEIKARIDEKKEAGEFVYEKRVLQYHLSKEDCDNFIYRNIGTNGEYVYLHGHIAREALS